MIITPHPYGRLANRLALATHWICHVEKYGGSYLHLAFADYARYFKNTRSSLVVSYHSTKGPIVDWNPHRLVSVDSLLFTIDRHGGDYPLSAPAFLEKERNTRILITLGWNFRDFQATTEFADVARRYFEPAPKHAEATSRFTERCRQGTDTLIGVHIRQTDYAKFMGGKWLFPLSEYRRCMEAVAGFSPCHTRFLIASDSPVDPAVFHGLDVVFAPGHTYQDNLALAQCDLLIGPPSTYNQWASFYGKVPLFRITEVGRPVQRDQFEVMKI